MKQLTSNIWVETEVRGRNFGFVTTSEGIVLIDTPHKPSTAMWLKAEIEKRGLLRYLINTEPHGDHWTGNWPPPGMGSEQHGYQRTTGRQYPPVAETQNRHPDDVGAAVLLCVATNH